MALTLTADERAELERRLRSLKIRAEDARRARVILMLADGASFSTIKQQLRTTAPTIIRWKARFLRSGMDGLDTHHPGQSASVLTPSLRARIL